MSPLPTVLFICEHGAAKSVIAAAYLPHLARAASIDLRAIARGTDPEPELSAATVAGLRAAGIPIPTERPRHPTNDELTSAEVFVSFGPDLSHLVPPGVTQYEWPDVPAVSDGFETARDAILTRLAHLIERLRRE